MKTPRCNSHAENTKFTDSEGWEALARDLERSLGVWMQHAKESDRKVAELERENAALREALQSAENGLRHGLMMEPLDPFKRGKIISEALDVVRSAIKEAKP